MTIASGNEAVNLAELYRTFDHHPNYRDAVTALQAGRSATFDGVVGSSCALLAANLAHRAPDRLLIVCPDPESADSLADDLELFLPADVDRFPPWDAGSHDLDEQLGQRLRVLKQLLTAPATTDPEPHVLCTSATALRLPVPPAADLRAGTRSWSLGDAIDREQLGPWLIEHGFHHTSAVELPGEFSIRGGIIDLFAVDWDLPVRLELFGEEIDSIRQFDTGTQCSLTNLSRVDVTCGAAPDSGSDSLFAYLPDTCWLMLVEPTLVLGELNRPARESPRSAGELEGRELQQQFSRFPLACAAELSDHVEEHCCRLGVVSVERFSGEVARVRQELDQHGQDHRVVMVAQTEAERQRLCEIFAESELARADQLQIATGHLARGFRLVDERMILISGAELFQRSELHRLPRRRLGRAIDSFMDLRDGDLVVHLAHGIGRYRGTELLTKNQSVEEHLKLEFRDRTMIYVPASRIDLVQKYVGGSTGRVRLAKIGGTTWLRQKAAAAAAVTDLAADMLALQAARQSHAGIAFGPDTDWQREFDAAFPYEETDDQLSAISAIKQDMHAPRPSDRLLCGDVGFGKTEVAMRAAFKAVDNGYQVAILVPTTILAEQHYRTFRQRMAEFPFDIARLSRFCSTREQRDILAGLAAGRIDIVIGTHRLASADIQFYNLGLVVIDEEQRFGVTVKERLKQLRSTVDVLTMTATPIPRTLHMSLVGVRDISNLEIPPQDRLAVQTRVARFDSELIRQAVLRELDRGGQIYFVHNRVHDIEHVAERLRAIVPEASLRVGHGQMRESDLEAVMVDFVNHRFDMLLATTIVESGLDIPNANTIFIDQADRYGLADLHQLRGRVGRYRNRAYCYLLVDRAKTLSPNAARRLHAIEEFSDMGAGFAIAMRDLEIRGAGNLLGTQQSGHIASVGYELYCQLLETAVRKLKQLPAAATVDVDLNLPGAGFLPAEYVGDLRFRIDLYRRLTRVRTPGDLATLRAELLDRFGPPPVPAERLLAWSELRLDAAVWQISAIYAEPPYLVMRYTDRARIEMLNRLVNGRLRIADQQHAYLPAGPAAQDAEKALELLKSVLRAGS